MKVTLDLDQLLSEGKITRDEYDKFNRFAEKATGTLAFNILIGFGVIAVSGASLALIQTEQAAIAIGLIVLAGGLGLCRTGLKQWQILANICVLTGALMTGGGILTAFMVSLAGILLVTALFAIAAVVARSSLLAVLATLMVSACIGARTGYLHASYFLVIEEPTYTILLFSLLSAVLYLLSRYLPNAYERLAIAAARTGLFLVNFGFWVGSLWGESFATRQIVISDAVFALAWALGLLACALWAWKRNRRWVLNICAVFGGIHFYTQWFERLGASPGIILVAGLLALAFAFGLRFVNQKMKTV